MHGQRVQRSLALSPKQYSFITSSGLECARYRRSISETGSTAGSNDASTRLISSAQHCINTLLRPYGMFRKSSIRCASASTEEPKSRRATRASKSKKAASSNGASRRNRGTTKDTVANALGPHSEAGKGVQSRLREENKKLQSLLKEAETLTGELPFQSSSGSKADSSAAAQTAGSPHTAVADPPAAAQGNGKASTSYPERIQENGKWQQADPGEESRPQTDNPMDIVFVSAEVAPWSKTGGLGDVVGSLPIALAMRGHRVMVIAPRYQNGVAKSDDLYKPAKALNVRAKLDMGQCGQQEVGYHHLHKDRVDWVFVDHPCYHRPGQFKRMYFYKPLYGREDLVAKTVGNPYADEHGAFGDNQFRYALLSMAACEAPLQLPIGGFRSGTPPGFPYGEKVLFVANDWHAALVPAYIAGKYRRNGVYKDARCVVAIHNLSHQGVDPASTFGNLGLPDDWYDPLSWEYPSWASITGPAVNILKGGVAVADRVLTVSQGYAWEITTTEGGWGMDGVLKTRQAVLNGIANGIDMEEWNPETDEYTSMQYSAEDPSGKAECKRALQEELGLPQNSNQPLIGFIGRLDHQKGPDLVLDSVSELTSRNCQVVMLGSGTEEYETRMREAENAYRDHFRGWVGFSVPVAHRMIAGCDIIIMPSRFEPCGLNQLFAMRYGAIPVAHATGGLRDTIEDFNPFAADGESVGTGWTFSPPDVPAMLAAIDLALSTYREHPESWKALMRRGMTQDLSWNRAAEQYEQIFTWAFMDPPAREC